MTPSSIMVDVTRFYNTTMTWTGAHDFCKQKGSELPVLMDTFEGARLNYEAYSDGEHTKFWTDVRFQKVCDFALLILCTCSLYLFVAPFIILASSALIFFLLRCFYRVKQLLFYLRRDVFFGCYEDQAYLTCNVFCIINQVKDREGINQCSIQSIDFHSINQCAIQSKFVPLKQ